ncbi:unnamed protein product [Symbiodinium pilosum]|uniref:Sugar phosphate transporter domain-containing protein n=1 Tax=Symbiodinium pilosum TaxID=2952 RepID=A0A812UQN5_SYMPI|nr:unnamed protein product [Symbiodinium pilosum]
MIFDGRRYNCIAYWAMIPVCGGAVISSWSEANFSLLGSALSALAVAFRALCPGVAVHEDDYARKAAM